MGRLLNVLFTAGILLLIENEVFSINLRFGEDGSSVSIIDNEGNEVTRTQFMGLKTTKVGEKCSQDTEEYICRDWGNFKMEARYMMYCTSANLSVVPGGPGLTVGESFNTTGHVYGGSQQKRQYWPLDDVIFDRYPYIITDQDNQGIAERYWLTSDGEYYYVGPFSPLFIEQNTQNNSNFGFVLETTTPYPKTIPLIHNFTHCKFSNVREAHMYAVQKHFKKPTALPDKTTIQYPTWSTSARYGKNITQEKVLKFADEIVKYGFHRSQIVIDDSWESCYGSFTFNENRFPDVKVLTAKLKQLGFQVALTLHPFINLDCEPYYTEALENDYFVKNEENETDTTWWNGEAGVIDFTNARAINWWTRRLRIMMDTYGIDSLNFDAGETNWLPQPPVLYGDKFLQPNIYTHKYAQTVATFGNSVVLGVGFQTQDLPVFVRMQSKDSRWDFENGLATLATTLFQMNMAGYPFVLADKVGGSGGAEGAPSKELFIRWLQAAVFMPAIQFSHVPWDYDNETVAIARKYTDLHAKVSHMVLRAMENARDSGSPVNFPIWWISPDDPEAQPINDEFLLGEDILVAPVLERGAAARDIYLPEGFWIDMLRQEFDKVITGPVWLKNYSAPIEDLPYFVKNSSLRTLCDGGDDGSWCANGAMSYAGGIVFVFSLSISVVLRNYL